METPDSAFRWEKRGEQDKHRVVHLGVLVVCSSGTELAPKSIWKTPCLEKDWGGGRMLHFPDCGLEMFVVI